MRISVTDAYTGVQEAEMKHAPDQGGKGLCRSRNEYIV